VNFKQLSAAFLILLCLFVPGALAGAGQALHDSRHYDPARDPFQDLDAAADRAASANKKVLVMVGGDWCSWCHILEAFLAENPDVKNRLYGTFEVVKVYLGEENYNEDFFSYFPDLNGVPHFYIVSAERTVLGSQSTAELEKSRSYDKGRFMSFIDGWSR